MINPREAFKRRMEREGLARLGHGGASMLADALKLLKFTVEWHQPFDANVGGWYAEAWVVEVALAWQASGATVLFPAALKLATPLRWGLNRGKHDPEFQAACRAVRNLGGDAALVAFLRSGYNRRKRAP